MKTFKVLDGRVKIDGVLYGQSPNPDIIITGKTGRIHSVNIEGKGQFFPIGGFFNDGSTPIVEETPKKKALPKTELVEKSGVAVDESGNLIKKSRKKK